MGIRRHGNGWQAFARVNGQYITLSFPPSPDPPKDWPKQLEAAKWRIRLKVPESAPPAGPGLGADVDRYLLQVQTMPTLRWRKDDLNLWLDVFGRERTRESITPSDIRIQLETWRAEGYAASTCNHRRTALMHLWTVLDGKSAPNPARDVPRYREPKGPPRALSLPTIDAILAAMPASQTKARLELMRWTGWPQTQIMGIEPSDVTWKVSVYLKRRMKGKGVEGESLAILPQAWKALRQFKRLGCWGKFSTDSMRKSFRLAAEKVAKNPKLPKAIRAEAANVTPYQLRHTFGTLVAGITKDDRAVQTLMRHRDIRQTHRYTEASVDPRVGSAIAQVALATSGNSERVSGGTRGDGRKTKSKKSGRK